MILSVMSYKKTLFSYEKNVQLMKNNTFNNYYCFICIGFGLVILKRG